MRANQYFALSRFAQRKNQAASCWHLFAVASNGLPQ
jgi:hypothetical protein